MRLDLSLLSSQVPTSRGSNSMSAIARNGETDPTPQATVPAAAQMNSACDTTLAMCLNIVSRITSVLASIMSLLRSPMYGVTGGTAGEFAQLRRRPGQGIIKV